MSQQYELLQLLWEPCKLQKNSEVITRCLFVMVVFFAGGHCHKSISQMTAGSNIVSVQGTVL